MSTFLGEDHCTVDGVLVASKKQNISMFIALLLVILNIFLDRYAVYNIYQHTKSINALYHPMLFVGFSTTGLFFCAIVLALVFILKKINGWSGYSISSIMKVWWSELGVYLIRGVTPFILALQFVYFNSSSDFLVTYQLILQLSYILCMPFIGAMQVGIREASQTYSANDDSPITWWSIFFYTGLLPTSLLLITGVIFILPIYHAIYQITPPPDQIPYLYIFLIATLIGQVGNGLTIPLRAMKKNHLVTKNFLSSEMLILVGGTEMCILFYRITPLGFGFLTFAFTFVYTMLNFFDVKKLSSKLKRVLI